ncbi:MAG: hypothetical protein A2017_09920 [Lentisphaerae bacterium GWF2_44_16]|nr:MAG: hypothetical protein A2017_09920 [Lentisphaerae bacterium GWF2_44_16]
MQVGYLHFEKILWIFRTVAHFVATEIFNCFTNSAPKSALHINKKSVKQKRLKFANFFWKKLKKRGDFQGF